MPHRDVAIVIGIEHYPRMRDRSLPGADDDATEMARWLTRPGGCVRLAGEGTVGTGSAGWDQLAAPAFQPPPDGWIGDLCLLRSRDQPESILRKGPIEEAFKRVVAVFNEMKPSERQDLRRLTIFGSGHGFSALNVGDDHGLICGDHAPGNASAISLRSFLDWIARQPIFVEHVLLSDYCMDVAMGLQNPLRAQNALVNVRPEGEVARLFFLGAAPPGWQTRTLTIDGRPRGAFTKVLLDGLTGGAAPRTRGGGGRPVRGHELHAYVKRELPALFATARVSTAGTATHVRDGAEGGGFDIEFRDLVAPTCRRVEFEPDPSLRGALAWIVTGAPPTVEHCLLLDGKTCGVELPRGHYCLVHPRHGLLAGFSVNLSGSGPLRVSVQHP